MGTEDPSMCYIQVGAFSPAKGFTPLGVLLELVGILDTGLWIMCNFSGPCR